MMRRVKHRFLLRVPWYFSASALSFALALSASALSLAWSTAWEKMETLASSCAFLEPPGSLMAPGPGDTERGDWAPSLLPVFLTTHHLTFQNRRLQQTCFKMVEWTSNSIHTHYSYTALDRLLFPN